MSAANTPQGPAYFPPRPSQSAPGSWTSIDPSPAESNVYMPGYYQTPYSRTNYQPTPEQLERDELRRAYLKRNVYAPVIVAVALVILLFLLIFFLAFVMDTPAARSFIAGMAGLMVILMSIPLIALMTLLPVAWLALRLNRRQQRNLYPETGPMAYRSRVQIILWQLETLIQQSGQYANRGGDAVTRPLMKAHATIDYWRGFGRGLKKNFTRSETNEFE